MAKNIEDMAYEVQTAVLNVEDAEQGTDEYHESVDRLVSLVNDLLESVK